MTAELSVAPGPGPSPFLPPLTKQRISDHKKIVLERIPKLRNFLKTELLDGVTLFPNLPDAERFSRRMFSLCAPGGSLVASFPAWSWVKGPVRKVRYEWIGDCPIFNYNRRELEQMFGGAGFDPVEILAPGRSGYLLRAYRP